VSYYRDGSRENQVLTSMKREVKSEPATVSTTTVVEALTSRPPVARNQNEAAARRLAKRKVPREQGAIRLERPRELSGATWRIPFDGQNPTSRSITTTR
jgi:hypothetical protein